MAKSLQTSLTVPFGDSAGFKSIQWEIDKDREPPEFHQEYVRLYPQGVPVRFATSGTLLRLSAQTQTIEEVVVFSGTNETALNYPEGAFISLQQFGLFYGMDGNPTTTSYAFDKVRNLIESTKPGYGAVIVTYTVNYTLFLYTFGGGPCPGSITDPYSGPTTFPPAFTPTPPYSLPGTSTPSTTPEPRSPFDHAVLVAIDPLRGATATQEMTPPECERQEFFVNKGQEANLPTCDLVIDPDFPERIRWLETEDVNDSYPIWAGCRVRLIPATTNATVRANWPDSTVKEISKNHTQYVEQALSFSGSTSVNLDFQPKGSIGVIKRGTYRNKYGDSELVYFRGPGEKVTEVEWTGPNSYRNPRTRYVGADELVCVNSWGRALEIFGLVDVTYTYSYDLYDVSIPYDSKEEKFRKVFLTAINEDDPQNLQPGELEIEPPSLKGTS